MRGKPPHEFVPLPWSLDKSQVESNLAQILHEVTGQSSLMRQDPFTAKVGKDNLYSPATEIFRPSLSPSLLSFGLLSFLDKSSACGNKDG
jgi:hypothetical protein